MLVRREDFKDVNKLSNGSHKKVWFVCDWCGMGVLQAYRTYLRTKTDLCRDCRNKETANREDVNKKQSIASKNIWKNLEYKETVSAKISENKKEWWSSKSEEERIPANKRSYDELKQEVNDQGLILDINREQWEKNNYVNVYVRCPVHSLERFKFRKGHNCPYCSGLKIYLPDLEKNVNELGYHFVSVNGKYIEFYCDKGHYNKISYSNWKTGTRCIYCSGKNKIYKDDIIKEFGEYGFDVLSTLNQSTNSKTKIHLRCRKCRLEVNRSLLELRNKIFKCDQCYKLYLKNLLPDKESYYYLVKQYTLKSMNNYSYLFNPNGLEINWDNTLDHNFSVIQGMKEGVLPCVIGSPINLQILSRSENCRKNSNCWITKQDLFDRFEKFIKTNSNFISLI